MGNVSGLVGSVLAPVEYAIGEYSGAGVDTADQQVVIAFLAVGECPVDATLDAKIQESDEEAGTYTDVAGAAFAQVTPANDHNSYYGSYRLKNGSKRWVKLLATVAGADDVWFAAHLFLTPRSAVNPPVGEAGAEGVRITTPAE
jgi:hypothetical protein